MARTTRAVWKKRVERWERSGQSAARFAARLGVNQYTLKWWRWALAAARSQGAATPVAIDATQFVELVHGTRGAAVDAGAGQAGGPTGADAPDDRVELRLPTGVRVFLPARFDVNAIAGLVGAFERP